MKSKEHPWRCLVKNCYKTAWDTPEHLTAIDFLQRYLGKSFYLGFHDDDIGISDLFFFFPRLRFGGVHGFDTIRSLLHRIFPMDYHLDWNLL